MKKILTSQTGSTLVFAIAVLLVFSVIGAAIVAMTTSSQMGAVGNALSQQAYLLAESGGRYAGYKYKTDMSDATLEELHNKTVIVEGDKSFELEIRPHWFSLTADNGSTAENLCALPQLFTTAASNTDGVISVNGTLYDYTGYTLNGDRITFLGTTGISGNAGDQVFPAARAQGSQTLQEGKDQSLILESGKVHGFPLVNGIVQVRAGGTAYFLKYDRRVGNALKGLSAIPGEPSLPFSVSDDDGVILSRFADLTATGRVGTGSASVTRSLTFSQPLKPIEIYKRKTWTENFDSPSSMDNFNSILGGHNHAVVDDNGALKVTRTWEEQYYTGWSIDVVPYRFEESVVGLDHTATNLGIYDAWKNSEETLSYDLQAKVRFTAQDDVEANYLGTYLPGICLRLNADASRYYGFSILRGIPGYKYHFGIPGWREVRDDIPDTLYNDHGNDSQTPAHNDDKPMAGMPYLVLWQKAPQSVWSHLFDTGDSVEKYEWLSHKALCDVEVISNIYYYPGGPSPIPGSCGPCKWWQVICQACCDNQNASWPCGSYWSWANHSPRGWFIGDKGSYPVDKGNKKGPFTIYKLTPKPEFETLLQRETLLIDGQNYTFLGQPGQALIRSSATGKPVENVAFILPENPSEDFPEDDPGSFNYRIYPKAWITLMARILEFKKDLNGDGTPDKCNAIQAWAASPQDVGRGVVKHPEDGSFLKHIVWDDYTSKEFKKTVLGWSVSNKSLLAKIKDDQPAIVYSAFLTTRDYPDNRSQWNQIPEVGLHTLGIDVNENTSADKREAVFFDDFSMSVYEARTGLHPPVQSEK